MTPGVGTCVVWWEAWAVVVGSIVGLATIRVSIQAKKASERAADIAKLATDIADKAKDIAEQQFGEGVALREGSARILGSLLQTEISMLPTRLGAVFEASELVVDNGWGTTIERQEFDRIMMEMRQSFLSTAEEVQDRLHNLPGRLGERIASLIGMGRALTLASLLLNERIKRPDDPAQAVVVNYLGDRNDFLAFKRSLGFMLSHSIAVAHELAEFTHSEADDFAHEEALLKRFGEKDEAA